MWDAQLPGAHCWTPPCPCGTLSETRARRAALAALGLAPPGGRQLSGPRACAAAEGDSFSVAPLRAAVALTRSPTEPTRVLPLVRGALQRHAVQRYSGPGPRTCEPLSTPRSSFATLTHPARWRAGARFRFRSSHAATQPRSRGAAARGPRGPRPTSPRPTSREPQPRVYFPTLYRLPYHVTFLQQKEGGEAARGVVRAPAPLRVLTAAAWRP